MHRWGDKDVDWAGINDCCEILSNYCLKWARLGGSTKEKFGTVRFYAQFNGLSLHNLFYPGYHYYQFSRKIIYLDENLISKILSPLNPLFFQWQKFIYKRAYKICLKKYPHLREEILCCADYPEYLNFKD